MIFNENNLEPVNFYKTSTFKSPKNNVTPNRYATKEDHQDNSR